MQRDQVGSLSEGNSVRRIWRCLYVGTKRLGPNRCVIVRQLVRKCRCGINSCSSRCSHQCAGHAPDRVGGIVYKPFILGSIHITTSSKAVKLCTVACGGSHCLAVDDQGRLFSWGHGSNGRLGLGDTEDRHDPCCVYEVSSRVDYISCGNSHSVIVTGTR